MTDENCKILTGPYAGQVLELGWFLDVPFSECPDDLKAQILSWAEDQVTNGNYNRSYDEQGKTVYEKNQTALSMEDVMEDFENSWEYEITEEPVTLKSLNEQ